MQCFARAANQGGHPSVVMSVRVGRCFGDVPGPFQHKFLYHAVSESRNGGGTQRQADTPSAESSAQTGQAGGATEAPQGAGVC